MTCPFAAIQAAVNAGAMGGSGRLGGSGRGGSGRALEHSTIAPTSVIPDLTEDSSIIPEGHALNSSLPTVTGTGRHHVPVAAAAKQGSKLGAIENQPSFSGSHGGASKTGSKMQGSSAASKSRRTKKTRSSSKSRNKNPNGAMRRTKKAPTFSSWEAQTYIPPIKKSWDMILHSATMEQVGVVFYDTLMEMGGHREDIKGMFTTEKSVMAGKVSGDAPLPLFLEPFDCS